MDISKSAEPIFTNLPGIWQMGCSRKVKLLVSESFHGWEGGSKRSLSLRTQLHKMQHDGKTDLLSGDDGDLVHLVHYT